MVEINGISFAYDRNAGNILQDISFDMDRNRCMAILGNNGAGKSTLLKCIDRICPAHAGAVYVHGANVFTMKRGRMAQHIAYVAQQNVPAGLTVFDTVLLGRKPYIRWDATEKDHAIAVSVLRQMGLESYALRNVAELSGGEVQKVMLARALVQEPQLLLLDEPTSNLDPRNQHEVLSVVKRIAREHNTCVALIIHDLNLAIRYCDRFLFLKDSAVYSYGGVDTVTPERIEAVYRIHVDIIRHRDIPVVVPLPEI